VLFIPLVFTKKTVIHPAKLELGIAFNKTSNPISKWLADGGWLENSL
jgi:hypothetical protein